MTEDHVAESCRLLIDHYQIRFGSLVLDVAEGEAVCVQPIYTMRPGEPPKPRVISDQATLRHVAALSAWYDLPDGRLTLTVQDGRVTAVTVSPSHQPTIAPTPQEAPR